MLFGNSVFCFVDVHTCVYLCSSFVCDKVMHVCILFFLHISVSSFAFLSSHQMWAVMFYCD